MLLQLRLFVCLFLFFFLPVSPCLNLVILPNLFLFSFFQFPFVYQNLIAIKIVCMSFLIFFFFLYRHTCVFRCFLFLFFSAIKDDALHRNTLESEKRPKTADTIRSNESSKEEFSVFPYERSPSTKQKSKHTPDQKDAASVKARTWRQVSSDEDGKYEGRSFLFWSSHVRSDIGDGNEVSKKQ